MMPVFTAPAIEFLVRLLYMIFAEGKINETSSAVMTVVVLVSATCCSSITKTASGS